MISFEELKSLSRREKILLAILAVTFTLMFLSHQPEWFGVGLTLTFSWAALVMFVGMIGVLIFLQD